MRQGMMGADVQTTPAPQEPIKLEITKEKIGNNIATNLNDEERQLLMQLNIPQFRDFMSKVFGPEFGILMQESVPEPQPQPQPVSPQSESPAPTTGEGMMTQPPVR